MKDELLVWGSPGRELAGAERRPKLRRRGGGRPIRAPGIPTPGARPSSQLHPSLGMNHPSVGMKHPSLPCNRADDELFFPTPPLQSGTWSHARGKACETLSEQCTENAGGGKDKVPADSVPPAAMPPILYFSKRLVTAE